MLRRIYFVVLVLLICCSATVARPFVKEKRVLILNSYHPQYKWTSDIVSGIFRALKADKIQCLFHVEYMDSKRFQGSGHFELMYRYYKEKYRAYRFDLIICSDDNAFQFLKRYRNRLFGMVPTVFCGVNFFSIKELQGMRLVTGVAEQADLKNGIKLIEKVHSGVTNLVVVSDRTKTGRKIRKELKRVVAQKSSSLSVSVVEGRTFLDVLKKLNNLRKGSVVLYTIYAKDEQGKFYEYNKSTSLVVSNSAVPVYALWDFCLNHGVVGGLLTSGFFQGRQAGQLALRILKGEAVEKVPIHLKSPNKYMVDYRVARRFGIDTDVFPTDTIFINRPYSFYRENKGLILFVLIAFFVLIGSLVMYATNYYRRKRIERQLRELHSATERKVEEQTVELKFLVEELVALFENSLVGIALVSGDGVIVKANNKFAFIFGGSLADIVGSKSVDLCGSGSSCQLYFEQAVNQEVTQKECRLFREDGSVAWCQVSSQPLDKANSAAGSVLVVEDISVRKKAQHELDFRNRQLQFVLEGTNDGFWDWDIPSRRVFYSDRFAQMFGYEPSDLNYENNAEGFWNTVLHPEDRHKIREKLDEHLAGLLPYYEMEYRLKSKNGEWRWVLDKGRIAEYNSNGAPVRMTGLVTDITGKKERERLLQEAKAKAEEANAAKDKFFSIIAHDLRGPIGSFSHGVQYLHNKIDASIQPNAMKVLDALWDSSQNIYTLLDNLLQWSRAQSNKLIHEPVRIQLRTAVEDLFSLFVSQADKKSIALVNEVDEALLVYADQNMVHAILRNLLSNAVKFSHEEGRIWVSAQKREDFVEVVVTDTGVGISPKKRPQIFSEDPFSTVGTSSEKGTGLGLLLCREFVEKGGGRIWFESEPGEGAAFHFTLPAF